MINQEWVGVIDICKPCNAQTDVLDYLLHQNVAAGARQALFLQKQAPFLRRQVQA